MMLKIYELLTNHVCLSEKGITFATPHYESLFFLE